MEDIDERFKLLIENKDIKIEFDKTIERRKETMNLAATLEVAALKALRNSSPNIGLISIAGPVSALLGTVAITSYSSMPILSAVCSAAAVFGVCTFSNEIMKMGNPEKERELKYILSYAEGEKNRSANNIDTVDSIDQYKKKRLDILSKDDAKNDKDWLIKKAEQINKNIAYLIENDKNLEWTNKILNEKMEQVKPLKFMIRKKLNEINQEGVSKTPLLSTKLK